VFIFVQKKKKPIILKGNHHICLVIAYFLTKIIQWRMKKTIFMLLLQNDT